MSPKKNSSKPASENPVIKTEPVEQISSSTVQNAVSPKKGSGKGKFLFIGLCGIVFLCFLCGLIAGGIIWWRSRDKGTTSNSLSVNITSPSGSNWYSTYQEKITLAGIALDESGKLKNVKWSTEGGSGGEAEGTESWKTSEITLKEGDNKITVTAYDDAGNKNEDSIFVVYNKDVIFLDNVKIKPDYLFMGDPEVDVIFQSKITKKSSASISEVILYKVDEQGEIIEKVGNMTDSGIVAEGDDIPSDGNYGFTTKMKTSTADPQYYRVTAVLSDSVSGLSGVAKLTVIDHVSQATTDEINNLNQQIQDLVNQNQTAEQINTFVGQQPGIASNGVSPNGQGVWWVYENTCIPGGLLMNPAGTKGGASDGNANLKTISIDNNLVNKVNAQDGNLKINNTNALYLGPYIDQFGTTDDYYGAWEKIKSSQCPLCQTTEKKGSEVTVEDFKNLSNYGIVVISSHGDSWYGGQFSGGNDICAEGLNQAQVVILTGQKLTADNLPMYEADLMARRLAVHADGTLVILPAFITHYNSNLPNSLIYTATCRSSYNNTMAAAFLGAGAKTYFGFDDYVLSSYCFSVGTELFDNFLIQGDSSSISYNDTTSSVGSSDGQGADFLWSGDGNLLIGGDQFTNTGFEEGTMSSWGSGGDAKIITSLGSIMPTEGNFMSIISTGLGSVSESTSSIGQNICFNSNSSSLSFDFNLVSDEPMTFLGSDYDDRMRVYLVVNGAETEIFNRGVNDSSWTVLSGFDFAGGDEDTCSTGWQTFSYSLAGIPAGASLQLKFVISDVGDSAYDTAALIDNIKIE